jgi:hypothetical protein
LIFLLNYGLKASIGIGWDIRPPILPEIPLGVDPYAPAIMEELSKVKAD